MKKLFLLVYFFVVSSCLFAKTLQNPDSIDVKSATLKKNAVFPIFFYSDETSFAAGVMDQYLRQPATSSKVSSLLIFGFFTLKKQYMFELKPELYFANDRYKLEGEVEYKYWPTMYFGMGNNPQNITSEEYINKEFSSDINVQRRMTTALYVGMHYLYHKYTFSDLDPEGELTKMSPPGIEGGPMSGLGISMGWDTRDDNIYPKEGAYHQFNFKKYTTVLGGNYDFNTFMADIRFYRLIFENHILAMQNIFYLSNDRTPFKKREAVGDHLRGYEENKLLGSVLHVFQIEYRFPLFWRVGGIVFAGAGQVSNKSNGFQIGQYNPASGFGFRFNLIPEKNLNLRIDAGFGNNNMTIDMQLMEAF